ncbi:MAG: thymidine kinase [Candidatus Melainabacteria bacterium]|nr:thymidine kinase [Candidatus Melainabacteria bacterium]
MAKLYFRYGTVGSAKTLNLLAVAHNYRQQGKHIILLKPEFDVRFGKDSIKSRAGLEMTADVLVNPQTNLLEMQWDGVNCILVDEAQFISARHIDELRKLTLEKDIPVICYGLRTDFRTKLFEGSLRLMEVADSIEEVKATCHFCTRKSIMNIRHVNGKATLDGPTVQLGAEESYYPVCCKCYTKQTDEALKAQELVTA